MRTLLQLTSESNSNVVVVVVRIGVVTDQGPNSVFVLGHLLVTEAMDLFPFLTTSLFFR